MFVRRVWHQAKLTRGQQLDAFHVLKKSRAATPLSIEGRRVPYKVFKNIAENISFVDKQ